MIPPNVKTVIACANYVLSVTYVTGERVMFDVKPLLHLPVYQTLKDPKYFSLVKPFMNTVAWPGEEDIAPEKLYRHVEAYRV